MRLHDLRHFAATILLSGGKDVKTVSGRLGHANAATTLGVYAHFIEAADADAADHLGAALRPASARGRPSQTGCLRTPVEAMPNGVASFLDRDRDAVFVSQPKNIVHPRAALPGRKPAWVRFARVWFVAGNPEF